MCTVGIRELKSRLTRRLMPISREVIDRARRPFPTEPIRSLDAIHLASAMLAADGETQLAVLSLDRRIRASAQFLAAVAYILRDNPAAARRFRQRAERVLRRLEQFPQSGVLPEFPELPYREVIVAPYRFFYRVVDAPIWVVGVWHGAQIPEEPGRGD